MCRLCRLEFQVRKCSRTPTVRPAVGSAWSGAAQCATCFKRERGMKLCSGCRCIRYCSLTCQRSDWKHHKPLCSLLRGLQPLSFVYPWHMRRTQNALIQTCSLQQIVSPETVKKTSARRLRARRQHRPRDLQPFGPKRTWSARFPWRATNKNNKDPQLVL